MSLPISVTYTFATATSSIPLSELDANFTTVVNGINGIGNGTNALANVNITGGNATVSSLTSPTLNSSTTLSLQTGGTTGLYIDTSQNVGIGTTSPSTGIANKVLAIGSSSDVGIDFLPNNTDTSRIYSSSGELRFSTVTAIPQVFYTNAAERMRIDSSGNLLVGTTSVLFGSNNQIAVKGNSTNNAALVGVSHSDGSITGYFNTYGGTLNIGSYTNSSFTFNTNNAERMRIDSSGNLLVGGTSVISGATFYSSSANGTCSARCTTTTAGHYYTFGHDGNDNFRVLNAANAGVYLTYGGTSWTALSDERFKENLTPITNAANKVASLRAVTGNYIDDETKQSKSFLIAQDVDKILPEAVDKTNPSKLGLSYTDVIPLLVAAIQEIKSEFDAYKATHP